MIARNRATPPKLSYFLAMSKWIGPGARKVQILANARFQNRIGALESLAYCKMDGRRRLTCKCTNVRWRKKPWVALNASVARMRIES